jgi:hypothetical protein
MRLLAAAAALSVHSKPTTHTILTNTGLLPLRLLALRGRRLCSCGDTPLFWCKGDWRSTLCSCGDTPPKREG